MAVNSLFSALSLILLAGGILLQFLVVLSGAVQADPTNKVYFLQAATNGIPYSQNPVRWTFFSLCGVQHGRNANCRAPVAAMMFDPPHKDNFGTTDGVPDAFVGTKHYYYLSRFMDAFYYIALLFAVMALFTGLLALCSRLAAKFTGLLTFIALFFQAIVASLMTAWTVQARNAFRRSNHSANLGVYGYAFTWTAFACFLLSSILFCVAGSRSETTYTTRRSRRGIFGRKRSVRSTRSRGSFIDTESQRRAIKDEYT